MMEEHIAWFENLTSHDVPQVGGKNASLGEMVRTLKDEGVRVPDGFATTASAFREYVAANGIEADMRARLAALKSRGAQLNGPARIRIAPHSARH